MSDKKKFGLIMSKKADASNVKKHSVFGDDESDEDRRSNKRPKIPQKKIDSKSKVKPELVEDPSIYEYDNIYDEMKLKQAESIAPKEKQNSRYIETLMKAADKRKKEYERRLDKKIQVEREKEGDKYKDKEAFVTSSYKKKMEELEEEEERERRKDMLNDMMDVTKQKDISGFYRHFLKQTVGEEKVPEFGDRKIKKEPVCQDDFSQNFAESAKGFKNVDQDSDGVEVVDSDDDGLNLANEKYTAEEKKRKQYAHSQSSHNLARSSKDCKNLDQDNCRVEIDSDEDKNEANETPKRDNKRKKSSTHSQFSHSLSESSKDYKNLDEDSDGVEIDSDEDEKHNTTDKGKKSHNENSSKNVDLITSHGDSGDTKSKKGKEKEHVSGHRAKSLASQHTRIEHRKSSKSSNSDSSLSDDEQDGSIKKKKDQIKGQKSDKNNNKHSRHDTDSSSSDDSDNIVNENATEGDKFIEKSSCKKSPKRNIYAKRTVGAIFSEAQAKYFQRMALRDARA